MNASNIFYANCDKILLFLVIGKKKQFEVFNFIINLIHLNLENEAHALEIF